MKYVALLRGINVGGKAKVEMTQLKALFEQAGATDVRTYINSGNVIFMDDRPVKTLDTLLERAFAADFGFHVPMVVRTRQQLHELCEIVPEDWTNDAKQKTDVLFLWDEINDGDIIAKIMVNPDIEQVKYIPTAGALVWSIGRENVTAGGGVKLIKSDLYAHMTVRNINTVRKLAALMGE